MSQILFEMFRLNCEQGVLVVLKFHVILLCLCIVGCNLLWDDSNTVQKHLQHALWKSVVVRYCLIAPNGMKTLETWNITDQDELDQLRRLFEIKEINGPLTFRLVADSSFQIEFNNGSVWKFYYHNRPNHISLITAKSASFGAELNLQFYNQLHKMLKEHLLSKNMMYECELLVCQPEK